MLDRLLGPQAAPGAAPHNPAPQGDVVELRWIFAVLRRRWWLVLLFALLGASLAFALSYWQTPVYNATSTLLIQATMIDERNQFVTLNASEELARTYIQVLTGRPVLEATIAQLGLTESPGALAGRTTVRSVPNTKLIQVSVEDTDPSQASLIANTIAEEFAAYVRALQTQKFNERLSSLEDQISELSVRMEEAQSQIQILNRSKVQEEADLASRQDLLAEYRSEHRTLKQNLDDLSLTVSRLKDMVITVEAAEVPGNPVRSPYTATLTLLVNPAPGAGTPGYPTSLTGEGLVSTYAVMLTGHSVLEATIAQLDLAETPDALGRRVKAEPVPATQLIRLVVRDTDPAQAAQIANAIAAAFLSQVQTLQQQPYTAFLQDMQERKDELETSIEEIETEIGILSANKIQTDTELRFQEGLLAEYRADYRRLQDDYGELRLIMDQATDSVNVVEAAETPRSPISSGLLMNTALAAAVGASVGIGLAFLLEYLDDTIETPGDVHRVLGLDTLGAIGPMPKSEDRLVVLAEPHSMLAESFRMLAANVRFSSQEQSVRSLLVTSPSPLEGKSFILANLAATTAQMGLSVVAVDADFRRPSLHQLFGVDVQHGLTDWLRDGSAGRPKLDEVGGVKVLTSGNSLPGNPAELMASRRMEEVLQGLRKADLVFLDSPPVLPVVDAVALAQRVDGVLLVLRAGRTRRDEAQHGVDSLRRVGANVMGVVLNAAPNSNGTYRYYSHYDMERRGIWRRWPWRLFGRKGKARQNGQASAGSPPERDGDALS
jgi:capsular exopolysaccharide synthesis family protein